MAVNAYTDETPKQQDERVLEQLLEGIQTPSVKREFRLRRPTCLQAALTVADQLEQVDESMGPMEPCCVLNRYSPARFQPPDRRNWNRVPFRGDYSRPPVQSYFRRPRPLHQEEEISRQAVAGEIFKKDTPSQLLKKNKNLKRTVDCNFSFIPSYVTDSFL
ncbi:unnamed protein product [Dicrocoelium dendriticum]|nr:unnamed protein product [Dicrocoelium dendriticum]